MAAAKALTIVDRWEVGGEEGGERKERKGEEKDGLAEKEDDARGEKKWIQEWIFNLIIVHEAT